MEEWLSGITDLSHGASTGAASDQTNRQMYAVLYDMQRVLGEMANRMEALPAGPASNSAQIAPDPAVRELASGVDQLVRQMRAEQKVVREWVDEQSAQQSEVAAVLKDLASSAPRRKV